MVTKCYLLASQRKTKRKINGAKLQVEILWRCFSYSGAMHTAWSDATAFMEEQKPHISWNVSKHLNNRMYIIFFKTWKRKVSGKREKVKIGWNFELHNSASSTGNQVYNMKTIPHPHNNMFHSAWVACLCCIPSSSSIHRGLQQTLYLLSLHRSLQNWFLFASGVHG